MTKRRGVAASPATPIVSLFPFSYGQVNALQSFPLVAAVPDPFAAAYTAVNAWRGHCLSHFSRMERAVTEALLEMAQHDQKVALPHLAGQRLATLEAALAGDTNDLGRTLFQRVREHDRLRSFLAHGTAEITMDQAGRWHAYFDLVALRHGAAERSFLAIRACEAEPIRRMVQADCQRLESHITQIASSVGRSCNKNPPMLRTGTVVQETG